MKSIPLALKSIEVIVVVRSVVAAVVGAAREARIAEVLVVEGRRPVGIAVRRLVVVAHRDRR